MTERVLNPFTETLDRAEIIIRHKNTEIERLTAALKEIEKYTSDRYARNTARAALEPKP